jgi:hypothetical protein
MIACGTGDLQQVKALNGKSAVEVDNTAHTICDNLKKKYPYEYKQYSPNHDDSRSAASSRKIQQTAGKKIKQTAQDINKTKFDKFCGTKGLMSSFRTWSLTNSPKILEQLKITDKTPACDIKYFQAWYATLNPIQKVGDKKFVYLGELFKYYNDFAKTKEEALKAPNIKSEKDTNKNTNYVNKHQGIMINGQLYDIDGETGRMNMVKLGKDAESSSDIQDWVNWISFALEFIPGFGNLASSIVDIASALVDLIKSYLGDNVIEKVVDFIQGGIGLAMAFVPSAGNVIWATVKQVLEKLSKWWTTLLSSVNTLLKNGKITKTLASKLTNPDTTTTMGVIFAMLMKKVTSVTKEFLKDYIVVGINGVINLLNEYIDWPGAQTLIDILTFILSPISATVEFMDAHGEEIRKIPENLSQV